jgi:adenylosuccinate synthase
VPGQCVIGLQWGDEAKGKLVDLLTEGKDLVVRYQGGANAGHTIVIGDAVYKLHHIPSGIIHQGVLNLIAPGVVVNPPVILREIRSLQERGIDVATRMKVSDRAHVVMPWHVLEDQVLNRLVSGESNIGTTLRGIGPCYADKVGRSFAIRIGDLIQPDFAERVQRVWKMKQSLLRSLLDRLAQEEGTAGRDPLVLEGLDRSAGQIVDEYQEFAEYLRPMIADTTRILLDAVDADQQILFEGAQGSLLDIDHGTFPFVTSSNSSGLGIAAGSGVPGNWMGSIIGVCKAYSTRVGGGPFPTELDSEIGQHIREQGNEYGTTTGRPRRCGWFDAVAVRYTARLGGVTSIALTMLDVLSQLDSIQVCVAYELEGQRIDYFPSHAADLKRLKPVYQTFPGWQQDVSRARNLEDLPPRAVQYLNGLEKLIGRKIEWVSVGPDRAETILIDRQVNLEDYVSSQI